VLLLLLLLLLLPALVLALPDWRFLLHSEPLLSF
jgi:hypothetical protein